MELQRGKIYFNTVFEEYILVLEIRNFSFNLLFLTGNNKDQVCSISLYGPYHERLCEIKLDQ